MVLNVRLEAEGVGQPDLPWRRETRPGGRSVLLEPKDIHVSVVPVVDIPHVDLHAPVYVPHDLLAVAEGQVDRQIGVCEVALLYEWLIDAEILVENDRIPTVYFVLPASGAPD